MFANARSELAEDEESLAKLKNPVDFLGVFRVLLGFWTTPSLISLSCLENGERDVVADACFFSPEKPSI